MSREVRRVPANWQHPKTVVPDHRLNRMVEQYHPMHDRPFAPAMREWYAAWEAWERGERHLMMYESTSEGTPISPAFATPEELARWLVDNNASAFGNSTASYEGWLRIARGGYACSAVMANGVLESGVEALKDAREPQP